MQLLAPRRSVGRTHRHERGRSPAWPASTSDTSGTSSASSATRSNISLRQLAKLAGVSNPYLSQIERGLRKPSAEILQQIAKALRISAEALYVQAGILEQREGSGLVADAVLADDGLTERQKQVLLEIYDSFRKENAAPGGDAAVCVVTADRRAGPAGTATEPTPPATAAPRKAAAPQQAPRGQRRPPAPTARTARHPHRPAAAPTVRTAPPPRRHRMSTATAVDVDVDKTGNTVTGRFTLKNLPTFDVAEATKPLFAVVGVADLAIEQAKEVPADSPPPRSGRSPRSRPQVKTLPAQVKGLRGDVETRVEKATEKATDLYAKLTVRGERLVTQIRRQPATEAAIAEGKEAVQQGRGRRDRRQEVRQGRREGRRGRCRQDRLDAAPPRPTRDPRSPRGPGVACVPGRPARGWREWRRVRPLLPAAARAGPRRPRAQGLGARRRVHAPQAAFVAAGKLTKLAWVGHPRGAPCCSAAPASWACSA